jgi:hypothetical protein
MSRVLLAASYSPAELQVMHRYVVENARPREELRAVVETLWPELKAKLPPRV